MRREGGTALEKRVAQRVQHLLRVGAQTKVIGETGDGFGQDERRSHTLIVSLTCDMPRRPSVTRAS